jgi:hypothetical protein
MKAASRLGGGSAHCWLLLFLLKNVAPSHAQVYAQANWMEYVLEKDTTLKDKPLSEFLFPGSHDAGTYALQSLLACDKCGASEKFGSPIETILDVCKDVAPALLPVSFLLIPINPLFAIFVGTLSIGCLVETDDGTLNGVLIAALSELFIKDFAEAQSTSIFQQLQDGSRHFDLRFFGASLADQQRSGGTLVEDNFYIHHTLAGSTSTEIFADIAKFLALGHKKEIITLAFNKMEMQGRMNVFFEQLYGTVVGDTGKTIGNYIAPRSIDVPGNQTTINDVLSANKQVIVTLSNSDRLTLNTTFQALVWDAAGDGAGFWYKGDDGIDGYPDMALVNSDSKLFEVWSSKVPPRTDLTKRWVTSVAIGSDDPPVLMIQRKFLCTIDPLNVFPLCTAINDDWDRFASLQDVAAWTNPKMVPALTQVPRDQLNIVWVDHYTPDVTDEFVRLNLGVARVQMMVHQVQESKNSNHDYLDVGLLGSLRLSSPDYYPSISILPSTTTSLPYTWAGFGGVYLETTGDKITPNWSAIRSIQKDEEQARISLIIYDGDFDDDEVSQIAGTSRVLNVDVNIKACIANETLCRQDFRSDPPWQVTQGPSDVDESSIVRYAISVCEWSQCPPIFTLTAEPSLYRVRLFRGTDRVDKEVYNLTTNAVFEGETVTLQGSIANAGAANTFELYVEWGDGGDSTLEILPGTVDFTTNHTYLDDPLNTMSDYKVQYWLTGAALSGPSRDERLVEVRNVAPSVEVQGASIDENREATIFITIEDPGVLDTLFAIEIDWGDGTSMSLGLDSVSSPQTVLASHTYTDDDPTDSPQDSYTVKVTVTDKDDGIGEVTATVQVANIPPTISLDSVSNEAGNTVGAGEDIGYTLVGLQIRSDVSFADEGPDDTHTLFFDWGDGTIGTFMDLTPNLSSPFEDTHVFSVSGDFPFSVSVLDDDSGSALVSRTLMVVYMREALQILSASLEILVAVLEADPDGRALVSKGSDKAVQYVSKALTDLQGKGSENGKSSAIAKAKEGEEEPKKMQKYFQSSLGKIIDAMKYFEKAGPFLPEPYLSEVDLFRSELVLIAKAAAVEVYTLALSFQGKAGTSKKYLEGLVKFATSLDLGDEFRGNSAEDDRSAVKSYQDAIKALYLSSHFFHAEK